MVSVMPKPLHNYLQTRTGTIYPFSDGIKEMQSCTFVMHFENVTFLATILLDDFPFVLQTVDLLNNISMLLGILIYLCTFITIC